VRLWFVIVSDRINTPKSYYIILKPANGTKCLRQTNTLMIALGVKYSFRSGLIGEVSFCV